jgi:hypothetical protein
VFLTEETQDRKPAVFGSRDHGPQRRVDMGINHEQTSLVDAFAKTSNGMAKQKAPNARRAMVET